MAKPISSRTAVLAILATMPGLVHSTPAPVGQAAQTAALDSIEQGLDAIEGQARRSIFSGGSKPVSFAGEAIFRFLGTSYDKYPSWMTQDVTETKNSSATIRIGMVAAPHRNLRLWSKIGFNAALLGYNKPAAKAGDEAWQHSSSLGSLDVRDIVNYEDMSAGLIAKTGPVTSQAKIGGVLWTEASPFTLWKGQNRIFGWDYVPYELEQSNGQYYEYATLKGEKTGRAAWNKKPFQGLSFESIEMPWNLYYSFTYGSFDQGQKYQPYMLNMNTANGLMATNGIYDDKSALTSPGNRKYGDKGIGIGDSYRKTLLMRLAKAELPGAVTMGLNYVDHRTDSDYPKQFWNLWSGTGDKDWRPIAAWFYRDSTDSIGQFKANYYLNTQVASVDFRRNLPGGLQFHVDVGFSNVDTIFYRVNDTSYDEAGVAQFGWRRYGMSDSATIVNAYKGQKLGSTSSGWTPSVYASVSYPVPVMGKNIDLQLQSVYIPKKFYSTGSFVLPADVFFPYESNLTGVGKFASADNGTPYVSNMVGSNLTTKLPVANGHAKINFGFHSQLEKGSDLIFLPWRLNGTAFNYSLNASTSRYDGATLTDAYMLGNPPMNTTELKEGQGSRTGMNIPARFRQVRRFGDEFFNGSNPLKDFDPNGEISPDDQKIDGARRNPYAPQPGLAGGIRNDYLATFEAFGAYQLRADSAQRIKDLEVILANRETGALPQSKKATQNLSIDIAKDIARYWGGKNSIFLAFYGAMNSITKSGAPFPTMSAGDDVLLSSYYLRFEPVVQITPKFYLIGLLGHERWKSDYGVASIDSVTGINPDRTKVAVSAETVNEQIAKPANWHAAPIDYYDWSYGIGADIELASRVGLHLRLQRFTHEDKGISKEVKAAAGKNDYQAWFLHAETKMWF